MFANKLDLLDLEAATAKFDKEKFYDQVDRKEKKAAGMRDLHDCSLTVLDTRDPFFDVGLSTDASDAKNEQQKSRGAQRKMERKLDELTFGAAEVNAYESNTKNYGKNSHQRSQAPGPAQTPTHTKAQTSHPNQTRPINQPAHRGNVREYDNLGSISYFFKNTGPRH